MLLANDIKHNAEIAQGRMWRVKLIFILLAIALPD
jgi:hypothetical protein